MTHLVGRRSLLAGAPLFLASAARADVPPLRARFANLYKAASEEGQVVHYTSALTEEARELSSLWKENFPAVQLKLVAKSAPTLINQIETDRNAGQTFVDVVTITEPYVTEKWLAEGLLEPYKVAAYEQLGSYAEAGGSYYITGIYLLPPAYNPTVISDKAVLPKTFKDFLNPAWNGKMVLADPKTAGGPLAVFMGMLQLGKIDWNFLDRLGKQDVLFVSANTGSARIVISGERPLSPIISTLNILPARKHGQSINFFTLAEGSVTTERPSAIFAKAPHPKAAKLLLEVLTSAEGQQALAAAGLYWPTNSASLQPGGLPKLADLRPIRLDIKNTFNTEKVNAFLARFDQAFGRS